MSRDNSPALPLDVILLLTLATAHFWFNPISNALSVAAIAVYLAVSWFIPQMPDETETAGAAQRYGFLLRLAVVLYLIAIAIVLPTGLSISQRLEEGPSTHAHDGLVQTEVAMQYVLEGRNPYREDYRGTAMDIDRPAEPPFEPTRAPLDHLAYLPMLFISQIPLYWLSQATLGWYDQRLFHLLLLAGLLIVLPALVARQRDRLSLLMLVGLNFTFAFYHFPDGRNDIVILFGLALTTLLMARGHGRAGAVVMGLTAGMKHLSWFFLPFYFLYHLPREGSWAERIRGVLRETWPFFVTVAAIIVPFLLWDAEAFIDDTLFYLLGSGEDSFPIRGWGISVLLWAAGIVPEPESPFPFAVLALLAGIPVLLYLLRKQWRDNQLSRVWLSFGVFSFTLAYFNRFFNDNYAVFIFISLVVGAFIRPVRPQDED